MKRFSLLLVINFIFSAGSSDAQNKSWISHTPVAPLLSHTAKTTSGRLLASMVQLNYNEQSQVYDSAQRTFYDHNTQDSISREHVQNYNSDKRLFQDSALISLTYDAGGHQAVWLYQRIFADNGSTVNSERDSSAYDSHNNLIYSDKAYWNGSQWTIFFGIRFTYTYNKLGDMNSRELSQINTGSSTWLNQYKALYKLDNNENIIAAHEYYADILGNYTTEDSLRGLQLYHNDVNRVQTATYVQDSAGKWIVRRRYTASYNTAGMPLKAMEELLNGSKWTTDEVWTWKYNTHSDRYYYSDSVMSAGAMQFYDGREDNLVYDADGDLSTDEVLSFNTISSAWEKKYLYVYAYKSRTGISRQLQDEMDFTLYPNPANHELRIICRRPDENINYTLLDMSGRVIQKLVSGDVSTTMDLTDIKSGIYTLLIEAGNKTCSRLVVKE